MLRSGDQVRVSVRLIHGRTEKSLWAETFQRELREILGLQGEIVQAIAEEVRARLTPQEKERFRRARTVDRAAHEAYLKGSFHWNKRTLVDVRKGIGYFEQAVALDRKEGLREGT